MKFLNAAVISGAKLSRFFDIPGVADGNSSLLLLMVLFLCE